jgi:hypothetical protein
MGCDFEDEWEGFTCLFHATRTHEPNSFLGGIGCLDERLEPIWSYLYTLVAGQISQSDWLRFRREAEADGLGMLPMVCDAWMSDKGPYAFLFGETPLNPQPCAHDYLQVPELVESIGNCFDRKNSISLRALHKAATKPLLVKFRIPTIKAMHVGAALDYLVYRKAGWVMACVDPCFSGNGKTILPDQITKLIPVYESQDARGRRSRYHL